MTCLEEIPYGSVGKGSRKQAAKSIKEESKSTSPAEEEILLNQMHNHQKENDTVIGIEEPQKVFNN